MTEAVLACIARNRLGDAQKQAEVAFMDALKQRSLTRRLDARVLLLEIAVKQAIAAHGNIHTRAAFSDAHGRALEQATKTIQDVRRQLGQIDEAFNASDMEFLNEQGHSGPTLIGRQVIYRQMRIAEGFLPVVYLLTDADHAMSEDARRALEWLIDENPEPRLAPYWFFAIDARQRPQALRQLWKSQTKAQRKQLLTTLFLGRREFLSSERDM